MASGNGVGIPFFNTAQYGEDINIAGFLATAQAAVNLAIAVVAQVNGDLLTIMALNTQVNNAITQVTNTTTTLNNLQTTINNETTILNTQIAMFSTLTTSNTTNTNNITNILNSTTQTAVMHGTANNTAVTGTGTTGAGFEVLDFESYNAPNPQTATYMLEWSAAPVRSTGTLVVTKIGKICFLQWDSATIVTTSNTLPLTFSLLAIATFPSATVNVAPDTAIYPIVDMGDGVAPGNFIPLTFVLTIAGVNTTLVTRLGFQSGAPFGVQVLIGQDGFGINAPLGTLVVQAGSALYLTAT